MVLRVYANSDGDGVPSLVSSENRDACFVLAFVMEPTVEVFAGDGGVILGVAGAKGGEEVQMHVAFSWADLLAVEKPAKSAPESLEAKLPDINQECVLLFFA